MLPPRRIAGAIHSRIRPNEFAAKSRQFRLQQRRARHTRRLQVRLPGVKIESSMQNRTRQTRRRHCRRTSLVPHGGGAVHNDYILTMRRYDRGGAIGWSRPSFPAEIRQAASGTALIWVTPWRRSSGSRQPGIKRGCRTTLTGNIHPEIGRGQFSVSFGA